MSLHQTSVVRGLLLSIAISLTTAAVIDLEVFPPNIEFGVSTSAYQIEGAWDQDGKGESIWDRFVHSIPSPIVDNSTGDEACDSYHRYKEDVQAAADTGATLFRFSFAWTRILPDGYDNNINQIGINYYKNLVNEIRSHNMTPIATLYHWDLPQKIIDDGSGWTNDTIVDIFTNYARVMFKNFPEITYWSTINEPKQVCHFGYGTGVFAPGVRGSGTLEYMCSKNILKAHATAYRMYKREFPDGKAKIAIANDCMWIIPKTETPEDIAAADRQLQFECGMYYHPIYCGDWPKVLKDRVAKRSKGQGLKESRLPDFTKEEIELINGTHDFLAINHYYSVLAQNLVEAAADNTSYDADLGVASSPDESWVIQSNGVYTVVPFGFRKVLQWLKQSYGDHEIIVTEVGMTEDGSSMRDDNRISFFNDYFCNMLLAIYEDNVRVTGVVAWSLLNNFEWTSGYGPKFGLYHVNLTQPNKTRQPKKSVQFIQNLTKTRKLDCKHLKHWPGPVEWDSLSQPLGRPRWHKGLHKF